MRAKLTWDNNNTSEEGYRVYRSTAPMDTGNMPEPLIELPADTTEYIDEDAPNDTVLYYRVGAYLGNDEAYSEEAIHIPDPYWDQVVLCIPFNIGEGIVDYSKHSHLVSLYGNASISTAQAKFGGASLNLNSSTSDYVEIIDPNDQGFNLGSGDFTFECFTRTPYISASSVLFSIIGSGATLNFYYYSSSNQLAVYSTVGASRFITSSYVHPNNVWEHVALVKSGNNFKIFINGIQTASGSNGISFPAGVRFVLGSNNGNQQFLTGYVDEIRFTKAARYTANFTPPSKSFPYPLSISGNP